jgi:uncharacterized GH25 family protein
MKRFVKMSKMIILVAVVLFLAVPAGAHDLWINVDNYTPPTGRQATLNIGWGHSFGNPVGNFMLDRDRMESVSILDPNGRPVPLEVLNDIDHRTKASLNTAGTYVVEAKRKEGFRSRTTDGDQAKSRAELKNVLECNFSGGYAKAIINVGAPSGDGHAKPVGHRLEIVPLKNPGALRAGDDLPLQVLFNGEKVRTEIRATYAGFSRDGAWAYVTGMTQDGVGQVRILQPGIWLIKVNHRLAYPDPKVCDQSSYTATLTFEVK